MTALHLIVTENLKHRYGYHSNTFIKSKLAVDIFILYLMLR